MLRFNRMICALLVCMCVGMVYAKATKIFTFTSVNAGITENHEGDGLVMLNVDAQGKTHVQVSMSKFLPDTGYFVTVLPGVGRAAVSSNPAGNFQWQGVIQFDVMSIDPNPCVIVWRDDDGDGVRQRNSGELFGTEDRSIGCVD